MGNVCKKFIWLDIVINFLFGKILESNGWWY